MKTITRTLAASALAGLLAAAAVHAYDPAVDPTFVIKTSPIVFAAGTSSEAVLIEGTNLRPVAAGTRLSIRDLGQGSSEIKIRFNRIEDAFVVGETTRYWWVELEADGLPAETELDRAAGITYGDDNVGVADYVVSTKSIATLVWTLTPPKKRLRIQQTPEVTFPVRTGERKVTLSLAGSSLQDPATVAWLEDARLGLRLASAERAAGGESSRRVELPANSTTNVVLEIDGEPAAGSYSGSIALAAVGNPETQSFELEVLSSPAGRRWIGAGLILLGIALSFFVTVVARGWATRLQTIRAAALVAAGAKPLGNRLETARRVTGHPLEKLGRRLGSLLEDLGPRRLAAGGYLPPLVPVAIGDDGERTEAFKDHLQTLADRAKVLDEIVRGGVDEVVARWDAKNSGKPLEALDRLEALAQDATPADVEAKVSEVLRDLLASEEPEAMAKRSPRPGPRQLQLRLEYLQGSIWLIWAAVTLAAGVGVLILPNPGFGTPIHLLTCFFWGLGVQTAGDGLQQLTPAAVRSTLQLSAPTARS